MSAFNKFNSFVQDVGRAVMNLNADTLRILATNTAPNAADNVVDTTTGTCTVKATSNAAEIAAGNGYTKKGPAPTNSGYSQSGGTGKLILIDNVITAAGGPVGPFRYVVLYDDSVGTTATRPVIGWYDYGSAITLADTESITVDFDGTNGVLTLA